MVMPTASTSPFVSSVMTLAFQNVAYQSQPAFLQKSGSLSLHVRDFRVLHRARDLHRGGGQHHAREQTAQRGAARSFSSVRQAAITGAPSVISGISIGLGTALPAAQTTAP